MVPVRIRRAPREPGGVDERRTHDMGLTQHQRSELVRGALMVAPRLEDVVARAFPCRRAVVLVKHVPAKDQPIAGHLVVDPRDRLVDVPALGGLELDLATGVRGRGQQRGNAPRRRAQAGRIDAVPDERGAQVDLPPGVTLR